MRRALIAAILLAGLAGASRGQDAGALAGVLMAAPKWAPMDLGAALAIWMDGADSSTLRGNTGAPAANGAAVSNWVDKAHGFAAVQTTAASQPKRAAASRVGRDTVKFDGNDLLTFSGDALDVFKNCGQGWVFAVYICPVTTGASGHYVFFTSIGTSASARFVLLNKLGAAAGGMGLVARRLDAQASGTGALVAGRPTEWQQAAGHGDWSGGKAHAYSNAVLIASGDLPSSGSTSDTRSQAASIGFSTGNLPANSEVAEIIVVNQTITAAQRQQVEGYLAHKWGLTGSLPASHPYKGVAP